MSIIPNMFTGRSFAPLFDQKITPIFMNENTRINLIAPATYVDLRYYYETAF
ncbi:hypothetical protein J7426_17860 [Tropicibacter sp. R16_0]|uniref:hypothetical protein n=1 Tax=Tropicibacter sp. R16_0 TaxID=2821102 RepID=UPI001ADA0EF3|nr:hypothetical protein [Tropicibacter sp. R16_0]MBO9452145.1 hypothetical protein [Tropicibacter sp. R16_0]